MASQFVKLSGSTGGGGGGGGGTPASPNGSVQFNNSGAFGGSSNFEYSSSTGDLGLLFGGAGIDFVPASSGTSTQMLYDTGSHWSINGDGSASFASSALTIDNLGTLHPYSIAIGPYFSINNDGSISAANGAFTVDGFGNTQLAATLTVDGGFGTSLDGGAVTTDGSGHLQAGSLSDGAGSTISGGAASFENGITSYGGISVLDSASVSISGALGVTGISTFNGIFNNSSLNSDSGAFVTNGNGALSIYNGNATDGNGIVSILKSVNLTAQSASIGSTAFIASFTPAAGSHYRVTAYLVESVAGTGTGTVTVTLGWNDGIAARTVTSSSVAFGSLAAPVVLAQFMVINNTSPTYSTTVTGVVGTSKYQLNMDVEKLK